MKRRVLMREAASRLPEEPDAGEFDAPLEDDDDQVEELGKSAEWAGNSVRPGRSCLPPVLSLT